MPGRHGEPDLAAAGVAAAGVAAAGVTAAGVAARAGGGTGVAARAEGGAWVGVAAGAGAMICVGGSVAVSAVLAKAPLFTAEALRYAMACLILLLLARLTGSRLDGCRAVRNGCGCAASRPVAWSCSTSRWWRGRGTPSRPSWAWRWPACPRCWP